MEPKDLLRRKMKRLYDEINFAQQRNDYASAGGFMHWLEEVIMLAKAAYPDNDWIKTIRTPAPGFFDSSSNYSANLTTIKLRLLDIMDSLQIDFQEIRRVESFAPTVFNISQSQNSTQVNFQSLENITSLVNNLSVTPEKREEVTQLLDEYKKETESKTPNESKVKSILSKVFKISKEVGVPLFTHAVQSGYLTNLFSPS